MSSYYYRGLIFWRERKRGSFSRALNWLKRLVLGYHTSEKVVRAAIFLVVACAVWSALAIVGLWLGGWGPLYFGR